MRGRQYIFKEIVKYDTFIGSSQQVRFIVRIKTMGSARLQSAVLPLRPGRVRFRCADEHSRRSHHKGRLEGGPVYSAGSIVLETGIYEVTHNQAHRAPHDVVMLAGDVFPACDTCNTRVRFRLVRTAPYIFQDPDFEGQEDT